MEQIMVGPPDYLWFECVHRANIGAGFFLSDELEQYIVFVLSQYVAQPMCLARFMSDYHVASSAPHSSRHALLREIGDVSLINGAFYDQRYARWGIDQAYYVALGQASYQAVSEHYKVQNNAAMAALYASLEVDFGALVQLLAHVPVAQEGGVAGLNR